MSLSNRLLLLSMPIAVLAAVDPAPSAWDPVKDFCLDTWHDGSGYVTEPLNWSGTDWLVAGGVVGSVVAIGVAFDSDARNDSQEDRTDSRDRALDAIGSMGTYLSLVAVGTAWGIGVASDNERLQRFGRDALEASIISTTLCAVIKVTAGRDRPSEAGEDGDSWRGPGGGKSFPSGHTTQAFTVAAVAARSYDDEPWVGVSAFALAGLVGWSRINSDAHYASDVVAGAVLGTTVGWYVVGRSRMRLGGAEVSLTPTLSGMSVDVRW